MIVLRLPFPPSTNSLWRNVGSRTLKSAPYRKWLAAALAALRAQRFTPHKGSFRATVIFTRPDKRRRDIDNRIKALMDALKEGGVIEDDYLAQSITIAWAWQEITPGGDVTVKIEPADFPIMLMGKAA